MKMKKSAIFAAMLTCVVAVTVASGDSAVYHSGAYDNVVVAIKDSVSSANCKTIIGNIEVSLREQLQFNTIQICANKNCVGGCLLLLAPLIPVKKKTNEILLFFFLSGENLL